jgi:hypothetical protein
MVSNRNEEKGSTEKENRRSEEEMTGKQKRKRAKDRKKQIPQITERQTVREKREKIC